MDLHQYLVVPGYGFGHVVNRHDVWGTEPAVDGGLHRGPASPSGYWNTSSSGTLNTWAIWKAISREGE